MNIVRLRTRIPLFREDDGTTHIMLPRGNSLRFGLGFTPLLDELGRGIPEKEWLHRMKTDPIATQIDCTLGEHGLLEHADNLQAMPLFHSISPTRTNTAMWWLHVTALLAASMISMIFHVQIASTIIKPLPWQIWLTIPAALAATLLLHEMSHYAIARLCGRRARIKIWHKNGLFARCVISRGNTPLSSAQKISILAAGPWSDCLLLLTVTIYLSFTGGNPFIKLTAVCALLSLILNLYPSHPSDFYKILSLAPNQASRLWARRIYWMLLPLMAIAGLLAITALFGFFPTTLS